MQLHQAQTQRRKHSDADLARMSDGMRRAHSKFSLKNRPRKCQVCGNKVRRKSTLTLFRGKWTCGPCLTAYDEPLRVEDFALTCDYAYDDFAIGYDEHSHKDGQN